MPRPLERSGERLTLLDPLRLFASYSVAYTHTTGGRFLSFGCGLFLFLVMLFALSAPSRAQEPLGSFARRKGAYLLQPWLRWSLVYAIVFVVSDLLLLGQDPRARLCPEMLLYGTKIDLWFLPFAAIALVLVRAVDPPGRERGRLGILFVAAAGAVVATVSGWLVHRYEIPFPYRQWLMASPALPFGLALGRCHRIVDVAVRRRWLAVVGFFGLLACLGPAYGLEEDVVRRYAAAVVLVCVAFAFRPRVPRAFSRLVQANFGIYLVHPIVLLALKNLFVVDGWQPELHTLLVWSLSAAIVFALGRLLPVAWQEIPRVGRARLLRRAEAPTTQRAA